MLRIAQLDWENQSGMTHWRKIKETIKPMIKLSKTVIMDDLTMGLNEDDISEFENRFTRYTNAFGQVSWYGIIFKIANSDQKHH